MDALSEGPMPSRARRILVFGVAGSGKTTLARRVGAPLGIPWHSVDDEVGWLPGWLERPRDQRRDLVSAVVASDEWVLDTADGHRRDLVLARSELIVALDHRRFVSLLRLVRTTLRRVVTRELACNGNRESLRQVLSSDSILVWHCRSFAARRAPIARWMTDSCAPPVLRLRLRGAAERWLGTLGDRDGCEDVDPASIDPRPRR